MRRWRMDFRGRTERGLPKQAGRSGAPLSKPAYDGTYEWIYDKYIKLGGTAGVDFDTLVPAIVIVWDKGIFY